MRDEGTRAALLTGRVTRAQRRGAWSQNRQAAATQHTGGREACQRKSNENKNERGEGAEDLGSRQNRRTDKVSPRMLSRPHANMQGNCNATLLGSPLGRESLETRTLT